LGIGTHLQVEAGGSWFSDGNARVSFYGHYQKPLSTAVGRWVVLQPNLYAETFRKGFSAYVSPQRYLSAGLRGVAVLEGAWGTARGSLNPHFFRFEGGRGMGIEAETSVEWNLDPLRLNVGAVYFKQGDLYDFVQARLGISVLLGGR